LLVDDDLNHRQPLVQSPVRYLQVSALGSLPEAIALLEQSPFDVLLVADSSVSEEQLPGLKVLLERQPALRLWLLSGSAQVSLGELEPEQVFRWPISLTDLQLALQLRAG
jgi:ActR/RegA family two-component response regulator